MIYYIPLIIVCFAVLIGYIVVLIANKTRAKTTSVEDLPDDKPIAEEILKLVDLHYGRKDYASNRNYVEFYFHCCFYELFNIESGWESDLEGNEILDLLKILKIVFNRQLVSDIYKNPQDHSVEVFHSTDDEQVFAYFDLEKEPADGNDMFFLGISCKRDDEPQIHELLVNIYRKLQTTSPFSFDIWNHQLYNKVFRSYFYFYDNDYNAYKRQMHHHNLKQSNSTSDK